MANRSIKAVIVVSVAVGLAGFVAAQSPPPTKGYIPSEAFEDGRVDLDEVPDYVVVYARNGETAGYIAKTDFFVSAGPPPGRVAVVDESLSRVIGDMVAGRGFVPLGTPDEEIPTFEASAKQAKD